MTHRIASLFLAGALAAGAFAAPALADVVYDQPGTNAACAGACWTSSFGDGVGFQTFDDFTLASDATITGATWRGFIKPASGGPADPEILGWTVSISADSGGAPGATVYSHLFLAADVTATLLGVGDFGGPVNVYELSVDLPGFAATGGTKYWFSPLATQTHFYPFFSWSPAADTSGSSFQSSLPPGTTFVREGDRAFSLSAGVPEPGTWALMIAGFGAAGVTLRRRRAAVAWPRLP